MKTAHGIESSQRIEAMKHRIGMSGYIEARLDGAIDRLIESGDLATESTPREEPLRCCDCGRELVKAAFPEGVGIRCGTCWSLAHGGDYDNIAVALGAGWLSQEEAVALMNRRNTVDPQPQLPPDVEGVIERRLREDEQGAAMEGDRWE